MSKAAAASALPDRQSKEGSHQNARADYGNGSLAGMIPQAAGLCTPPVHLWAGPTESDQCIYLLFTNHHLKAPVSFYSGPPQHCEAHNVLTRSAQTALEGPHDEVQSGGLAWSHTPSPPLTEAKLAAPLRDESRDSTTTVHRGKTKLLHRLRIKPTVLFPLTLLQTPGSSRNRIHLPLSSAGC